MTTSTVKPQPDVSRSALSAWLATLGTAVSRYSLVFILLWIGLQKFTMEEAEGIKPLIMHSPLMSWMYSFLSVQAVSSLIGTVEITLAVLMALRPISPRASFFGSLGAIGTFLVTVSFLFTTPGVLDHTHAVVFLAGPGGFLIKDLVLLGCALWTAAEALEASSSRQGERSSVEQIGEHRRKQT